jgi:hypothetical protein
MPLCGKSSQQTQHSPRQQEFLAGDLANANANLRNAALLRLNPGVAVA